MRRHDGGVARRVADTRDRVPRGDGSVCRPRSFRRATTRGRDNGVKVIGADGRKLAEARRGRDRSRARSELVAAGRPRQRRERRRRRSVRRRPRAATVRRAPAARRSTVARSTGCDVVLDCANGAAFAVGPRRVASGRRRCRRAPRRARRAQHQRRLRVDAPGAAAARGRRAAAPTLGLALDGDGDRVLAVDEHGALVDGDQIMVMTALDLRPARRAAQRRDCRHGDVESRAAARAAPRTVSSVVETPVGDRHVVAAMQAARPRARRRAVRPHRLRRLRDDGRRPAHRTARGDLVRRSGGRCRSWPRR